MVILQCATSGAYELPKEAKERVRPGAIEIQIWNWSKVNTLIDLETTLPAHGLHFI